MRLVSPWILVCGIIVACSGADPIITPPPPPPPPFPAPVFVLVGIVEDSAGKRLPGAVATLDTPHNPSRTAIANDSGFFSFSGVSGPVTIRVSRDGHYPVVHSLLVTTDVVITLRLARFPLSEIVLGATIQSIVEEWFPPCDPKHWDEYAPCRRILFTAQASGTLSLLISWSGYPPLDATMVSSTNGAYVGIAQELGGERLAMTAVVEAGQGYEIRVSSFYGHQVFQLRADLVPAP